MRPFLAFAVVLAVTVVFAQQSQPAFSNQADDLKSFLNEVLSATKSNDQERVIELVKRTEIPNYRDWFYRMYPADKAESWVEPYGRDLAVSEQQLRDRFAQLAKSDGKFAVRKVNDSPEPGKGLEWGMLQSAREPLDIYFAGWVPSNSPEERVVPIGYFFYVDGMFRWDSLVKFPNVVNRAGSAVSASTGVGKDEGGSAAPFHVGGVISAPRVTFAPDPEYPQQFRKAGVQGTVVLWVVVDAEGHARNIRVQKSLQADLDRKAIEAVSRWKFDPAKKQGQPVAVQINVEVNFRLY